MRYKVRINLLEIEAMRDVVSCHETGQKMGDGTGFTAVRPKQEGVHPPLPVEEEVSVICRNGPTCTEG